MSTIAITEARDSLGAVVDDARRAPVYLTRHNRPVAVVLDVSGYERLRELAQEPADAAAAAASRREMEETKATPVPWNEVKAELGLA